MDSAQLLETAVSNLQNSFNRLVEIARDPAYLNIQTPETKELNERIANQFEMCFTLKNAFNELVK